MDLLEIIQDWGWFEVAILFLAFFWGGHLVSKSFYQKQLSPIKISDVPNSGIIRILEIRRRENMFQAQIEGLGLHKVAWFHLNEIPEHFRKVGVRISIHHTPNGVWCEYAPSEF